jgi:hypothetical protein
VVSGLVDVSFDSGGWSCTDDAISSASLDVHDIKNSIAQRGSNDNHPVGSGAVVKVNRGRIGEDGGSFWEGNAVLVEIRQSLFVVPFEIASMTVATTSSTMVCIPYWVKPGLRSG